MDKLALLDAGYTIQAQINTLKRGLPIAEAKAHTELEKIQIRKRYNAQILELRQQVKAINAVIGF